MFYLSPLSRKSIVFIQILLLLLINFSCTNSPANGLKNASINGLNGEDIFRGIFFLEGDIPKYINQLKPLKEIYDKQLKRLKYSKNQMNDVSDIKNNIIRKMKSIAPNCFFAIPSSYCIKQSARD